MIRTTGVGRSVIAKNKGRDYPAFSSECGGKRVAMG